jgi:predicted nucleic acid-binding protein
MDGSLPAGAVKYVLNTRPLLNFTYTGRIALLEGLLGKPICVPAEVYKQWKRARSRLERKLRGVPPHRHDPFEVQKLDRLQRAGRQFQGNPFRVLRLYEEERDLAHELERDHLWIHPGEADVLAVCMKRGQGWAAVFDDRQAHDFAVDESIHTVGTIELLLQAIRGELLSLNDGEHLLDEMRLSWPRAPRGKLSDYLKGRRAIW